MDGQYSCLLDNGQQFNFYVLQVSPKVDFFNALLLSVTISISLLLICFAVLFLDKYCGRPGAVVRPASLRRLNAELDPIF
jgi:hypothetical protein